MKTLFAAWLALFGGFSVYAMLKVGYWTVVLDPFQRLSTTQVFFDLATALGLFSIWMLQDWRKTGRPLLHLVPFFVGIVVFGSIGALVYLVTRASLRDDSAS